MAKTDSSLAGATLRPGSVDDTMPITPQAPSFFRAQGLVIQDGTAGRMLGKSLLFTLGEPIIAIHSDSRNAVWVETATQLIIYTDFFNAFL
jgi:hypothetical protein